MPLQARSGYASLPETRCSEGEKLLHRGGAPTGSEGERELRHSRLWPVEVPTLLCFGWRPNFKLAPKLGQYRILTTEKSRFARFGL